MTSVIFEPERCRISISGHAGAGAPGEDLICAGISALWMALEKRLTADRVTVRRFQPVIIYGEGYRSAECCPGEEDFEGCMEALETVAAGLRWMAEEYPEHVSFEEW
jgi:uncharacterized protein YsxB (DUF464 family)